MNATANAPARAKRVMAQAVREPEAATSKTSKLPSNADTEISANWACLPTNLVTADSRLSMGGRLALELARESTYDVEAITDALINFAGTLEVGEDAMVRCYAIRVQMLNSLVMSFLHDDGCTIADAHHVIYRDAVAIPDGALE